MDVWVHTTALQRKENREIDKRTRGNIGQRGRGKTGAAGSGGVATNVHGGCPNAQGASQLMGDVML